MIGDAIFVVAFAAAWAIVAWTLGVSGFRAVSPESYCVGPDPRSSTDDSVIARALLVRTRDELAADHGMGLVPALRMATRQTDWRPGATKLAEEALARECLDSLLRASAERPWELGPRARLYMFDRVCRANVRPLRIATAACLAVEGPDRGTIDTHRTIILGAPRGISPE